MKHQSHIGLPLLELWNLYLEANSTSMVRNFCIVYIEMAFDRLDPKVYASILSIWHLGFYCVDSVNLGQWVALPSPWHFFHRKRCTCPLWFWQIFQSYLLSIKILFWESSLRWTILWIPLGLYSRILWSFIYLSSLNVSYCFFILIRWSLDWHLYLKIFWFIIFPLIFNFKKMSFIAENWFDLLFHSYFCVQI